MINSTLNDRYLIEAEIGRGGMGVVYRAQDSLLERPVAVKVVSEAALGTEGRARLLSEARAAARLNHPNIVAVYDAGELEGSADAASPYIVMELVEGRTLRENEPGELQQIVDITIEICEALSAAHEQGIIHRDLKPENVAITNKGDVKLMDFGLARISGRSRLTQEGAVAGTLSYLAPEVILGGEATAQSDLYALGVMLYELGAGRPPFEGDSLTAVISQHLHAPVVPPSAYNEQIPPALDELIVGLLSKRPEGRPASAAALRDALKGLSWTVPESPPSAKATQLNRLVRGRIVGRETEFGQAMALWAQAAAGEGQLLLVSGEPGIGKTRLVNELVATAEVSGGKSFVGAGYAEGGPPYGPFKTILRQAMASLNGQVRSLPEPVLQDLVTVAPELALTYPELPGRDSLDALDQARLLESLAYFFAALSRETPLLIVLDDAHWADSGSLSLLRHLARNARPQRMMLVATYREVELKDARAFHELLHGFSRERLGQRIKLTRLDRQGTRALLAVLFDEEITPEFLDGIYRETEGNPFFVEEVCKALIESGKLAFRDGRWERPDIAELGIPQSIQVAIQSRVGGLPEATQDMLQQAAVLGREFDFETLSLAAGAGEDALIDALEDALHGQLIAEVDSQGGGTFRFVHALIPATLVAGLRTMRRRKLHRQAATALETTHPDAYEILAHQFIEAGETEKGVAYLLQAGDRARALYAHQEAIDSYLQGLEYAQEQDRPGEAARILMKLGQAYHDAFQFAEARQAYEDGFILWQQAGAREPDKALQPAPHALRTAGSEPVTLDPALATDVDSDIFIDQLFSGLVAFSPEADVVPDVAQSWEVLDGGRRYRFKLRPDVFWSDGVQVTAGDFEFAWRRALDPSSASPDASLLYDIRGARAFKEADSSDPLSVGIQVLDDFRLEVELERPCSYFLQILARSVARPVPRSSVLALDERWAEPEWIVTNGPFRLAEWRPGEAAVLERNPTYHGHFKGNVHSVEFRLIPGEGASVIPRLYELGDLDFIFLWWRTAKEFDRLSRVHADDFLSVPGLFTQYLGFNTRRPPFDDPRVRLAFALATDQERVVNAASVSIGVPVGGGLMPPGAPGHVPGIALDYDPEAARQLLAEGGYPEGRGFPAIELRRGRPGLAPVAASLQEQWSDILGVNVEPRALPWDEFLAELRHEPPPIWHMTWSADYPDPDNFLRIATWRRDTGWRNRAYEQLIEEARRLMDQGQRMALYEQAQRIIVEEAPIVPLWYGRAQYLLKPWVSRFPLTTFKFWFWKDVVIEPH